MLGESRSGPEGSTAVQFAVGEIVIAKFDDHEGIAKVLEVTDVQVHVQEEGETSTHWVAASHCRALS